MSIDGAIPVQTRYFIYFPRKITRVEPHGSKILKNKMNVSEIALFIFEGAVPSCWKMRIIFFEKLYFHTKSFVNGNNFCL